MTNDLEKLLAAFFAATRVLEFWKSGDALQTLASRFAAKVP